MTQRWEDHSGLRLRLVRLGQRGVGKAPLAWVLGPREVTVPAQCWERPLALRGVPRPCP